MEPTKKNKPGPLVIAAVGVIVAMIVIYFILMTFFPDLFQNMNTGEAQPVQ